MESAPHKGAEREFRAFARPVGDPAMGVAGPLVELHERRAHCLAKLRLLTLAETAQLHAELGAVLRTFELGAAMAAEGDTSERPRPYLGPYPIRGATLAEVDAAEAPAAAA